MQQEDTGSPDPEFASVQEHRRLLEEKIGDEGCALAGISRSEALIVQRLFQMLEAQDHFDFRLDRVEQSVLRLSEVLNSRKLEPLLSLASQLESMLNRLEQRLEGDHE